MSRLGCSPTLLVLLGQFGVCVSNQLVVQRCSCGIGSVVGLIIGGVEYQFSVLHVFQNLLQTHFRFGPSALAGRCGNAHHSVAAMCSSELFVLRRFGACLSAAVVVPES